MISKELYFEENFVVLQDEVFAPERMIFVLEQTKDNAMNTHLTIPSGGMFQEWMSLIDLIEEDTSKKFEALAVKEGWREVQPKEAMDMGFEELVDWSRPDTDKLVLIGNEYLVCLPKKTICAN